MNTPLKSSEMADTLKIFSDIYKELLDKSKNNKDILEWCNNISSRSIPAFMFRAESIVDINETIFTNEDLRTFVLDLCFNFFSVCNFGDRFVDSLCLNLQEGLNIDNGNISTIPEKIRQSFINSSFSQYEMEEKVWIFKVKRKVTFVNFLKSNKHFIIILLMCLVS